ncbi:cupin domain-containing protein [Candidatus Woesearchaeota archaeon]|nr:cupin domain-containing protein [Candidatus Woesearchaeota archaeon]
MTKIDLKDFIRKINNKPWQPLDVAKVNNQIVRIAYFKGEFNWHKHKDEDELFYIYEGSITIQVRNKPDIVLNKGEMALISKNVEHCPKSKRGAYVLMFEPAILKSKGNNI